MPRKRLYPDRPMVGVGILIQNKDEYLIVKRAAEPDKGLWSIPGGLVEIGEKTCEAAIREAKEETCLEVEIIKLIDVIDKIVLDEKNNIKYHFIILDYLTKPIKGKMRPQDDALEARWIKSKDLINYEITPTLIKLFKKLSSFNQMLM